MGNITPFWLINKNYIYYTGTNGFCHFISLFVVGIKMRSSSCVVSSRRSSTCSISWIKPRCSSWRTLRFGGQNRQPTPRMLRLTPILGQRGGRPHCHHKYLTSQHKTRKHPCSRGTASALVSWTQAPQEHPVPPTWRAIGQRPSPTTFGGVWGDDNTPALPVATVHTSPVLTSPEDTGESWGWCMSLL